jgi:hypothetical protein
MVTTHMTTPCIKNVCHSVHRDVCTSRLRVLSTTDKLCMVWISDRLPAVLVEILCGFY